MTHRFAIFRWLLSPLLLCSISLLNVFQPVAILAITKTSPLINVATESGTATNSGELAASESAGVTSSASAKVEQKIQEKKDQDLTETAGKQKSKLAAYLDQHPVETLTWHNPLQHAIRGAIDRGLPANLIVLLILFPLVASAIAASRHVIGLTGFGIYIPAVLAVAFVSTGLLTGVITFLAILIAAIITFKVIKRLKLPYLPRTAMLLWGLSVFILLLLIVSTYLSVQFLISISIFPLLIMMLLSENFMETQLFNSQKEAIQLTLETLILAIACSLFMGWETVQKFVLLWPELTLLMIAITNMSLGRYTGLRLLEYWRFQSITEKKS
ncbi:MAG TPA: hypothetical protein DEP87_03200 [Candidatus Pacebacteria bacterium]|nr:hypothetical protein [Candidatus Paceibacterota bacterium]